MANSHLPPLTLLRMTCCSVPPAAQSDMSHSVTGYLAHRTSSIAPQSPPCLVHHLQVISYELMKYVSSMPSHPILPMCLSMMPCLASLIYRPHAWPSPLSFTQNMSYTKYMWGLQPHRMTPYDTAGEKYHLVTSAHFIWRRHSHKSSQPQGWMQNRVIAKIAGGCPLLEKHWASTVKKK